MLICYFKPVLLKNGKKRWLLSKNSLSHYAENSGAIDLLGQCNKNSTGIALKGSNGLFLTIEEVPIDKLSNTSDWGRAIEATSDTKQDGCKFFPISGDFKTGENDMRLFSIYLQAQYLSM